jgi:NCAIR mutase (PurE)-related protein
VKNHESLDVFARLDFERRRRTGVPEAVFAEGKTSDQVWRLLRELALNGGAALATRVHPDQALEVQQRLGKDFEVVHDAPSRTVTVRSKGHAVPQSGAEIAVMAAGTADVPVAEEARITAELMGCRVQRFYDVGVAGIHRLAEPVQTIREGNIAAVVVAAGMEGALPTVVRGLVDVVVIGVPTSNGYGYGGKGEAALMTMLQSCAPGLTVVNIDNGFGAGATAALIANSIARSRSASSPEHSTQSAHTQS